MSHDDRLDVIEKEKYEAVWAHDAYRNWSPGVDEQDRAADFFADELNEHGVAFTAVPSVADYGCGEGKSVLFFKGIGFEAWGVDHARNAPKTAGILVYEKCLWDMQDLPESDFAFCCDVMEHIPPSKVHLVLSQIAEKTRYGAWFRIATVPDNFGPRIVNKPLHLTVESAKWWRAALARHFAVVTDVQTRSGFTVIAVETSREGAQGSTPTE